MNFFEKILVGIHHATYHRNVRKAIKAKDKRDIQLFKKYVYQAEDAWKKIVLIKKKHSNE